MSTIERSVRRWPGDTPHTDVLAIEEPLEIRVEGQPVAVTMRTPGHDLELAAGFLFTEGVIDGPDDLVAMRHTGDPDDPKQNTVDCVLAGGVEAHRDALAKATRELYATSSCGICGKASIDRIHVHAPPVTGSLQIPMELLVQLPDRLRAAQAVFAQTGGLHGAGLFSIQGELEVVREDIGRHNAVDKVLGWRLRQDKIPVDDRILVVSSRAGFEIVQKAHVAGVKLIVAMGAASSLAVELAAASGLALYGFVRDGRCTRYC